MAKTPKKPAKKQVFVKNPASKAESDLIYYQTAKPSVLGKPTLPKSKQTKKK